MFHTTPIALAARAALLAYKHPPEIEAQATGLGAECTGCTHLGRHVVATLKSDRWAIVAFRGTDEWRDWLTNLNVLPARRAWGWSHRGFVEATESLWPHIVDFVVQARRDGRQLLLTGHSLGGAMATVAALKTAFELTIPVEALVTFGQPPLLGVRWPRTTGSASVQRYVRFIRSVDVVSTAPFFPYFGHGEVCYIDAHERVHRGFAIGRYFRDAVRHGAGLRPGAQIGEHSMEKYVAAAEAAADS